MIVGQDDLFVTPDGDAAPKKGAAFGSWLLEAGKTWFEYDVAKAQAEAGSVLQAQGFTSAQAAAALRPSAPGLLKNPLVMGGLAVLAGIVVYKTLFAKK